MNSVFLHIWKYPMLLAVLTMFGLLSALLGTGAWHLLSWMALSVPVILGIRFSFRKSGRLK